MSRARQGIDRLAVVGYNHRQIPARLRGALSFDDDWCTRLAGRLRDAHLVDGIAFVNTCNRQEIVISAEYPSFAVELVRAQLHSRLAERIDGPLPEPYRRIGDEAARHVLRVAGSLDSLVVGEREITQQLRRSFDSARQAGWLDKPLNGLARIAIETAKDIHNHTAIGQESVGVFSIAKELVLRELAGMDRPRVAVVGLGEIGIKTARAFAHENVNLVLASRRQRSAVELGSTLEHVPFVTLDRLPELLRDCDGIVLATGAASPVIDAAMIESARGDDARPLVLVDIGIPPQAAAEIDGQRGVRLFNLDWFTTTGFGQRPQARTALQEAHQLIESGVERLAEWTEVRRYSSLFDSCVALTDDYKTRVLPDVLETELSSFTPEQRRLVFDSMHRVLTSYSEGLFQTLNRELRAQPSDHHDAEPLGALHPSPLRAAPEAAPDQPIEADEDVL